MAESAYLGLMKDILETGVDRPDRTGTGTRSVFGRQVRYDLRDGFPLLTVRRLELASVLSELLWFLEGSGDERRLAEIRYGRDRSDLGGKSTIWTANAEADYWRPRAAFPGDLGRVYGVQLRSWTNQYGETIDQVSRLIDGIRSDPYGRRHVLTWWNPGELDRMALPACHQLSQFYVADGRLSCMFTMRSTDVALGLAFNLPSYALLTHMVAQVCGLGVGELIYSGGDVHLYSDHLDAAMEMISRAPRNPPSLVMDPSVTDIFGFRMEHFSLEGYDPHPPIRMKMAV